MNSHEWSIADDPGQKPLTSGAQIGSYRIELQLGAGGMGTVYRALDTKLNRPVAVKFLSDELADAAARRGPQPLQSSFVAPTKVTSRRRTGMASETTPHPSDHVSRRRAT
jgi:serine/threonine protein kinase